MQIEKAESQDIEFKESWDDKYLHWICAFANTQGGILYVGVNDKGTVVGVADYHKLSESIPLKIRQSMGLLCDVNILNDGDLHYLQIIVEKYKSPVSYHGRYYKRVGSTTQEITGLELNELILKAYGTTWDALPVPKVDVSELDERAFKIFRTWAIRNNRFREEDLQISNKELLQNLRVYENGELNRAAIMAFHPDPEKWVIGAYTKIGYFANEADILFQDEVHGSLLTQVEDAIDIIYTKYMKALISYNDIHREELYFFPRGAFRELLLNALIHKDYTQPYPIQIQIYRDKIDIWNIGTMPETVQIKDLYQRHPSVPRNPKIADIFFKCGFIESWGRGYFKIKSICEEFKASLPEPTVLTGGLSVVCNASEVYRKLAAEYKVDGFVEKSSSTEQVTGQVTEQVTEQVKKLIECLKGKTLSKKEILESLNLKHRQTLEQDYITPALELGFVEMTQPDSPRSPTQKYRLTEKGCNYIKRK